MDTERATDEEAAVWEREYGPLERITMGGSAEGMDVLPCPVLVSEGKSLVIVKWTMDEIDLAQMANGGTMWLACWGGLPIHSITIIPKEMIRDSTRVSPVD